MRNKVSGTVGPAHGWEHTGKLWKMKEDQEVYI